MSIVLADSLRSLLPQIVYGRLFRQNYSFKTGKWLKNLFAHYVSAGGGKPMKDAANVI